MHKKTKAITVILLFTVIASILLSSCGLIIINDDTPEITTAPPVSETYAQETESDPPLTVESASPPVEIPEPENWEIRKEAAQELLNAQIDLRYEGSSLFIADAVGTFSDPLVENNVYSEAKYERNAMLLEKYGFEITTAAADMSTLFEEYKNTVSGGNTYSDMLSVPLNQTGIFITSGLIQNLRSLPFFEASGKYSIPSFDSSRAAGTDVYLSIGYGTLSPDDMTCLYFNREIANEAEIDLYTEVEGGTFTYERYCEILRAVSGTSVASEGLDLELISVEHSGKNFFGTGYGTQITLSSGTVSEAAKAAGTILSALKLNTAEITEGKTSADMFESGDVLFKFGTIGEMPEMSERKLLWGILPMPKVDAEGDYVTPVNSSMAALMITSNTQKIEMCSIAASAIHAASYEWLLDSAGLLYASYYVPDISSVQMIKLILENPVLDFSASASTLSDKYDAYLCETVRRYAENPEADISDILTTANLRALQTDLRKYYN